MWDSSYDLNVSSEQELIDLVEAINTDIEFQNLIRKNEEMQELLDIKYLLRRFRSIKHRDKIKEFRIKHDCAHCYYYEKPRRCKGMDKCYLEDDEAQEPEMGENHHCSRDKEGDCPYANEAGTCFGYCWKEILNEFKKKKTEEQIYE